jgi:hypothetical protein
MITTTSRRAAKKSPIIESTAKKTSKKPGGFMREVIARRRYVYLDAVGDIGSPGGLHGDDPRYELIAMLRDQLEAEREANRENRRIIAALASRIPEIEAPRDEPGSSESGGEPPDSGDPPQTEEATSRPWWRKMFGV